MGYTSTISSYWEPSLTEADVEHLKSLGLAGSTVKGNPWTSHLKRPGEWAALCGKEPGAAGRQRHMIDRRGWLVYESFERPGRTPCEACLKAAERLSASS